MISVFLLASLLSVGQLALPSHPCSEVSTNIQLVEIRDMREFSMSLSAIATESNIVEVAFGADCNGDGNLSAGECDLFIGNECGVWFVKDGFTGLRYVERSNIGFTELRWDVWISQDKKRTSLKANINNRGVFKHLPRDLCFLNHNWNLVKITTRGIGEVFNNFEIDGLKEKFRIIVR